MRSLYGLETNPGPEKSLTYPETRCTEDHLVGNPYESSPLKDVA